MDVVDLTPETMECMRCHREAPMRFYGLCTECRGELRAKYDRGRGWWRSPTTSPR